MKKCYKCNAKMKIMQGADLEGIDYEYYCCTKCGEEILDMKQLHKAAEKYKALRKAREGKFQKGGNSLAVRIPKQIADELHIAPEKSCLILKEKGALKILVT
ncbi:MAG: AbrB/MazE/SpoVT family DNA-binding domain-containing protein [Candidatus Woesearchaeota archaeon]